MMEKIQLKLFALFSSYFKEQHIRNKSFLFWSYKQRLTLNCNVGFRFDQYVVKVLCGLVLVQTVRNFSSILDKVSRHIYIYG